MSFAFMLRVLVIWLLHLIVVAAAVAGEVAAVRGVLLDPTGNPISGAKVTLGSRQEMTGDDGVFFFDSVPLGLHEIVVEEAGRSITKSVTVDQPRVHEVSIVVDTGQQAGVAKKRGVVIPVEGIVTHGTPAPDGGRIAIEVFGPSTLTGADVWLIGRGGEAVARFPNAVGSASNPRWSPDGKAIVYQNRLPRNRGNEIWLIDVAGGTERKVADGITPSFSPDGTTVVFSAKDEGNWDVYALTLASGDKRRLTQAPVNEMYPLWDATTEGGRILFSARESVGSSDDDRATYDLWQMAPDGGSRKRLTSLGRSMGARVFGVAASSSGKTLAFWLWKKAAKPDLWESRADGSQPRLILTNAANPEWGREQDERETVYYTSDEEGRQQLWHFDTTAR